MKKNRLLVVFAALLNVLGMWADGANLKLHFNFENATGGNVKEVISGGNIVGTLMNNAKVETMGKYHVLNLGSENGYFDMGEGTGKVLAGCSDFSISMYYYVNATQDITGLGNFLFTFSNNPACTQTEGCYYFYTLNTQRVGSSAAGYGSEKSVNATQVSPKGNWVNVVYVQKGTEGTLYVNGQKKASATSNKISEIFGTEAPKYNWIGRSPFDNDVYLKNTKVADIRIYDGALTGSEVTQLALAADDYDNEFRHGTQGNLTTLNTTLKEASTLINGDISIYTADAVAMLSDTYELIKAKSEKETLSQFVIDEYVADLKAAIQNVKATQGMIFTDTELMPAYDSSRGFRHPGGLHTNADFERIKAQLAAGNEKVTKAYNILKNAEFAQPTCATWPVETIIRGGSSGQNYINAARGATIAYQNALRWKIEGNEACAKHAVDVLMAWANTCKGIGGDSNFALAGGLYGYEFAQAAELMRDYEGWKAKDFETFKRWMLDLWYPTIMRFQRSRNDTWRNWRYDATHGGQRPGHYWSNWGLCNTLALMSVGILCNDVFIYNQAMSYYKYDQAELAKANYPWPWAPENTETDKYNGGLNEYIDNLVPHVAEYAGETGAYGKVGQMQETGRDQGHAQMAAGLAVDICQTAWNQGDDLYSYHDNRIAAGLEFQAAYNFDGRDDLPWVNYHYTDCHSAWHQAWVQGGPNGGSRGEMRPYWARVIGHYEGVKGVKMPFSEIALEKMGIDGGPTGAVSGPYDHMGYSVLTCTYDGIADEQHRPTLLTPKMEYDGKIIDHNELGGLENNYIINVNTALPKGKTVKLMPQLPEGVVDTGNWSWNTGETTKDITVTTDKSFIYRATYTNENGIKSEQMFSIAVNADCTPTTISSSIYCNDTWVGATEAVVPCGSNVTLNVAGASGWGDGKWSTGQTGTSITLSSLISDKEIKGQFINQGGLAQTITFRIHVKGLQPCALLNNRLVSDSLDLIVNQGDALVLYANAPENIVNVKYTWSNGTEGKYLDLTEGLTSGDYTLYITGENFDQKLTYHVMVMNENYVVLEAGKYAIYDVENDAYLTYKNQGETMPSFTPLVKEDGHYDASQVWIAEVKGATTKTPKYNFSCLIGGNTPYLNATKMAKKAYFPYYIRGLIGSDHVAVRTLTKEEYWKANENGVLETKGTAGLTQFPFVFIPVKDEELPTGITNIGVSEKGENINTQYYTVSGVQTNGKTKGVYIQKSTDNTGKVIIKKVIKR